MKDVLFQLKNHHLNSPAANDVVMNRAAEMMERHRSLVIEMLAMLSWLQSKGHIPAEIDIFKIELNARDILDIGREEMPMALPVSQDGKPLPETAPWRETVDVIGKNDTPNDQQSASTLPNYKICPRCGDRTPKIVHLRRRPKAGLECAACRYEYPWPTKWM